MYSKLEMMISHLITLIFVTLLWAQTDAYRKPALSSWRDEYSWIFTSKKVQDHPICLTMLRNLVRIEKSPGFQIETSYSSTRLQRILSGKKFTNYVKSNGQFSKVTSLRKVNSLASNLITLAEENVNGCDYDHLSKIHELRFPFAPKTTIQRYIRDSMMNLIPDCKIRFMSHIRERASLLGNRDIDRINEIYKSVTRSSIDMQFKIIHYTLDLTLDRLAEGISRYLIGIGNTALDQYDSSEEFASIYQQEIWVPCDRLCHLTGIIALYFHDSTDIFKKYWPRYHQFMSDQDYDQLDKTRTCCKIITLQASFITIVESNIKNLRVKIGLRKS